MKKKLTQFRLLAALLMLVAAMVMPSVAWAQIIPEQPQEGIGTKDNPYKISSAEQLYWFAGLVNGTLEGVTQNASANAELTANIEVNPGVLTSDGSLNGTPYTQWPKIMEYNGTFDGKGHTISGLFFYSNAPDEEFSGLFATTHSNAEILNLGIVDSYFHVDRKVGGVCGWNSGTIKNCYNKSTVSGKSSLGGVCGWNDGTIENCFNTGKITDGDAIGGVCGENFGTIKNCYNTGTISGGSTVGGVCGNNFDNGTITNCYYLSGTATAGISINGGTGSAESMTEAQFKRGEVCYLLNGSTSTGNSLAWYQNINRDSYPVLDSRHGTVYRGYKCLELTYSNNQEELSENPVHRYNNGICEACGAYQPATQNSGKYEIGNAGQLYWFAGLVNGTLTDGTPQNTAACAELASNITLNTGVLKTDGSLADDVSTFTGWTPIGSLTNKYTGTFDGKNYTVGGLYFNDSEATRVGLIGYAYNTTIANVGVIDAYINAKDDIGGVCGITENCTIDHCYNTGTISAGDGAVIGGVCGYALHSSVNNSYNTGTISAGSSANVGGVCGKLSGTLDNSHNTGTVTAAAEAACIGGVCGTNEAGTLALCYNTGAVNFTGTTDMAPRMGGVCGENTGTITNCYNSGALTSARYGTMLGGVCGLSDLNAPITNCYNSGTVSAKGDYVGGVCGYKKTGTVANCYYLDGCYANGTFAATTEGTATTTATFAGGSVAYLLAQGCSVAETAYPGNEWGQTIGTDTYPLLGGAAVYRNETYTGCEGNPGELLYAYANTPAEPVYAEHHYENGFCTCCGAYEPATLTTDKYDIDGNDTKDKVYEIGNAGQLYWFAGLVNGTLTDGTAQNLSANAVLVADIVYNENVLNETGELNSANAANFKLWTPIGYVYENPYKGIFDGKGHVIRGLYCTHKLGDYGYSFIARNEGTVKNLGIEDSYFEGTDLGGVCWKNYGTIENCYSISYLFGAYGASGICSENTGTIKNSFHIGTVKSGYYSHPICYTNEGEITNCFYLGDDSSDATAKTAAQFASGEVCYLLNGSKSDGAWGQTLSGTGKQDYPVLGGMPVYYRAEVYANTYGILTEGTQTITASSSPYVWYEFTPTETGTYQFSSTDIKGSICVNTTKTDDDKQDITTSPTYSLSAKTTYYVYVNYNPGEYKLTITKLSTTTALEAVVVPQIYAVNGRIVCAGEFRIYDLLGRDVTRLNGSLCGVYVVKIGEAAVKIVVK